MTCEWLRDWAPVFTIFIAFLTLVATVIIAIFVHNIRTKESLINKQYRELDEIINWAEKALKLPKECANQYAYEMKGEVSNTIAEYDRISAIVKGFAQKNLNTVFKEANSLLSSMYEQTQYVKENRTVMMVPPEGFVHAFQTLKHEASSLKNKLPL